jgi:DNA-binding transcriptional MocR family regulator
LKLADDLHPPAPVDRLAPLPSVDHHHPQVCLTVPKIHNPTSTTYRAR